jgi:hypothetical protein
VLQMWQAELDAMRRYRCLFNLCLHPYLTGRPSRVEALRELIEYAQSKEDISFTRCRDLAAIAAADPTLEPRTPPAVTADPSVYPD